MTDRVFEAKTQFTDGKRDISAEDYMQHYAEDHYEWIQGKVVKLSPINIVHEETVSYVRVILKTYFTLNPIGRVLGEPFVMRVDKTESRREPDLQVILKSNPGTLTDTAMIGPADICIEVVSPESVERDKVVKKAEYEKGGVGEYWIIDQADNEAVFYRLNEKGQYARQLPDENGNYQSPKLPGLSLHVPTLWQNPLPDIITTVQSVQAMLKK